MATLAIKVDAQGALQTLGQVEQATNKVTTSAKQQDATLRLLAEQWGAFSDTSRRHYEGVIRQTGATERFRQIQHQLVAEEQQAIAVEKQLAEQANRVAVAEEQAAVAMKNKTTAVTNATAGTGRLTSGLASLASQVTGTDPIIGRLAAGLSGFAVGGVVTAAVLVGVAAIGFAYRKLTADTRELAEETKKAIDRLKELRDEQNRGGQLGQDIGKAERERARLQEGLENKRQRQASSPFREDDTKALRRIAELDAQIAAGREEERRRRIAGELSANEISLGLERTTAENRKRYADEAKKQDEEALARLRERIRLLSQLGQFDPSAVLGNIDVTLGQGGVTNDTINRRLQGGVDTTDPETARRQREASQTDVEWRAAEKKRLEATNAATEHTSKLARAAQIASQSLEYYLVSKLGGGSISGAVGGGIGKALTEGLGGFGATKLGQAIFGPIGAAIGALVGNLAGKIGGLFGISTSAGREKERQAKRALEDVAHSMEILRAKGQGLNTTLLEQIEANRQYFEALKRQINEALPGKKNEAERNRERAEADTLKAKEDERIKADYERSQREKREDLEVRALRAGGKNKEADKLALELAQRRELLEAEKAGMDAAYIARLKEIQAIERTAAALNQLNTAVRNAPSGFKIESYINQSATPRPQPFNGPEIPLDGWSKRLPSPKTGANTVVVQFQGPVRIDARDKTPKQAFAEWSKEFKQLQSITVGLNGNPADTLDFVGINS